MSPDTSEIPLKGPRKRDLLRSLLLPLEVRGLRRTIATVEADVDGSPSVIVVPGLWASDRSLRFLRQYLKNAGYDARGWGLGRNMAGEGWDGDLEDLSDGWQKDKADKHYNGEGEVPALCDRFGARVKNISEELGRPVALVGWSLGGFIAREAARDYPAHVAGVITLGSPVVGGPKYTLTRRKYEKRGYDIDWIDAGILARQDTPIQCPVTSIYSKTDAIVSWTASLDRWTPHARHHEVQCSHTAFGYHPPSLKLVKAELDRIFIPS